MTSDNHDGNDIAIILASFTRAPLPSRITTLEGKRTSCAYYFTYKCVHTTRLPSRVVTYEGIMLVGKDRICSAA